MKIDEFKKLEEQQQLDELALSSFIGDVGAAAVKSLFTGKGMKHQMIQDMFLKDFYEDGITSLENAIKGGLVDPNIKGTELSTSDKTDTGEVDPSSVAPGTGEPGAPTAGSATAGAVAANKAQQQTSQNINNYVKQAASAINSTTDRNQKIALTKELVNAMADRQGTPEWNNVVKGVEGIIKRAGTDPSFASAAISNLRSGKTMSEAWRIYFANLLVESVGLTWRDLGLSVIKENKKYFVVETKFHKLNNLFESIVSLNENDGRQSISQYMLNWFNQYMTGVNWQGQKQLILGMLTDLENTYPKGYKAKIKSLAKTAFALSKSSTSMPLGMKDELSKSKDPNLKAAAQGAGAQGAEGAPEVDSSMDRAYAAKITTYLENVKLKDPKLYARLIPNLANDLQQRAAELKTKPATPAAGGTTPAPKTPTTEAKRRK